MHMAVGTRQSGKPAAQARQEPGHKPRDDMCVDRSDRTLGLKIYVIREPGSEGGRAVQYAVRLARYGFTFRITVVASTIRSGKKALLTGPVVHCH